MFTCHVCGAESSEVKYVSDVFNIDGKFYVVENIPATVCARCGEEVFSRETTERIRHILHGKSNPVRSVAVDVFSFDEAVSA